MNPCGQVTPDERLRLRDDLRQSMDGIDGVFLAEEHPKKVSAGQLRRAGRARAIDRTRLFTLSEVDGVLLWEEGAGHTVSAPGLRRGLRGPGRRGEIVERVRVDDLEPSRIGEYLSSFDAKLTPDQGLRRWDGTKLIPMPESELPVQAGKILLFIHGTFSTSDMYFEELRATAEGRDFLKRSLSQYKQILAFDHPTVSVSPVLNALDLARRFGSCRAQIDIVCHSRGGLVARWWLETLDRNGDCKRRAVLVGSPLAGTSLASPPRIRSLLSWFTNLNRVLSAGTTAAAPVLPFLTVVSGLLRMSAAVTNAASKTPVADAVIGLIPGLSGMSRVSNNFELRRLNVDGIRTPEYFVVQSNFQIDDPGWRFWDYFTDAKVRTVDAVSDLLFTENNDLVVDTASMAYLSPGASIGKILDFGTSNQVHHTNYFRQKATIDFISESLRD